MAQAPLVLYEEVARALDAGAPVVALESTIITHGMPYPDNVVSALKVEDAVRDAGAVPATIAVLEGRLRVGLREQEVEQLGASARSAAKLSRRDLPFVLDSTRSGGTTVAATMHLAHLAGISVFATGGIGGVHRGAGASFDVSADLWELARTPVAVVCSGCKSILDLAATLEVLESYGVPVLGYGTDVFPAFYCRESEHPLEHRAETPGEVAAMIRAQRSLEISAGVVVANPVPAGEALAATEVDVAIEAAVAAAGERGVTGKDVTPFLLSRIVDQVGPRALAANMALVRDNARLAAEIAQEL